MAEKDARIPQVTNKCTSSPLEFSIDRVRYNSTGQEEPEHIGTEWYTILVPHGGLS